MGRIFQEVGICGSSKNHKTLNALFDTGASYNFIGKEFLDGSEIYDLGILEFREEVDIILPNGYPLKCKRIKMNLLKLEGVEAIVEPEFLLFDMKQCDVIIGAKLMQELRMVLIPSIKKVRFN